MQGADADPATSRNQGRERDTERSGEKWEVSRASVQDFPSFGMSMLWVFEVAWRPSGGFTSYVSIVLGSNSGRRAKAQKNSKGHRTRS
jgi:hypothetical protein